MDKPSHLDKINLFTLIMITSAFTISIRNLPTIAEMGMKMLFFGILAGLTFFIPSALVSAELATAWPKQGGVYVWVKQAFGMRWGFITIWLQWIYITFSMIAILYFISASLAYVFAPQLSDNKLYLITSSLIILWTFTFLNMKGLKISGEISTIGFLSGVLFPGLLIIFLGILYPLMGNPIALDLSLTKENLLPNFSDITTLVLLVGFMRAFGGIEASAVHANQVNNPQKNYPIAILLVVIIGLLINIIGSLAVALVVPQTEISLVSGIMSAFTVFLKKFSLSWLVPFIGLLVAMGQMGGAATWLIGPIKGLYVSARNGDLPLFFQKVNDKGIPTNLLIVQACWISVICIGVLSMKTVNIAFWFSVAISMMVYVTVYFLMFLSAIRLRYKEPETPRKYRIPFGNAGMWITAVIGMLMNICSFTIALFPPAQLPAEHKHLYTIIIVSITLVVFIAPFAIYACRKPSWITQTEDD
jgi:glutamate:GABA antiporter